MLADESTAGARCIRQSASGSLSRRLLLPLLLLIIPLLILAAHSVELIDDAYITGRYALNLSQGHGLVYNPGEYVEGLTNLLWALVLALPLRAGISFADAAVWLGVGFGLLALLWSLRLSRLFGASAVAAYCAALALALNPPFWRYVASGLEGGLFAFLVTAALESTLARRSPKWTGLLAGLLFMTRPEGAVVAVILAGYLATTPPKSPISMRQRITPALELLVAFACVASAVTLFRWRYYGAVLPNSVTAKSMPLADLNVLVQNARVGCVYTFKYLCNVLPLTLGAVLALLFARERSRWLVLFVIAPEVVAVLRNGGDWMPHYRLLVVYTPLLVPLLSVSIDSLRGRLSAGEIQRVSALVAMAVLGISPLFWLTRSLLLLRPEPTLHGGLIECYGAVGERLAQVLGPSDVVTSEALGLVGYQLRDIYMHDALGLTDSWIAHHGAYVPRVGKVDYAYTYTTVHPAIILLHEADVSMRGFARASGGSFATEYRSYSVAPPLPCSHELAPPLLIAVRNDVHERVVAVLKDLTLVPIDPFDETPRAASTVANVPAATSDRHNAGRDGWERGRDGRSLSSLGGPPPHRSERELRTHSAPTSGSIVKAISDVLSAVL